MPAIQATTRKSRGSGRKSHGTGRKSHGTGHKSHGSGRRSRASRRHPIRTAFIISVVAAIVLFVLLYFDERIAVDQIESAVHAWDKLIHPDKKD